MSKITVGKLKKGKKNSLKKQKKIKEVDMSIKNKLNVIEDKELPALEALPIKRNTIEHWITPLGRAKIQAWKRSGLSKSEIASNMGITSATLWRWEQEFSLIREAMSLGREELVLSAEHALIRKALGYEAVERTVTMDNEGKEVVRESTKFVAPDFQSLQFFLTNMKPEEWRTKQEVAVDASVQGKFTNMTNEELEKVVEKFQKIAGDLNGQD